MTLVNMEARDKDAWVNYALGKMRLALIYNPFMLFTAESFIAGHVPVSPADPRWAGAVFQRAKRAKLIKQLRSGLENEDVTAPTSAGHRTPVWMKA